jgi:hypothetical protein
MRVVCRLSLIAALLACATCTGGTFVSVPVFDNSCFSCGPPIFRDDDSRGKYGP